MIKRLWDMSVRSPESVGLTSISSMYIGVTVRVGVTLKSMPA